MRHVPLGTAAFVLAMTLAAAPGTARAADTVMTGTGWTPQTSGTTSTLYGVACPTPKVCYAVGSGIILATTNGGGPGPGTWHAEYSGSVLLKGISCPSTTTCFAVGYSGTILGTKDGTTWSTETSGVTVSLQSVSCASTTTCFAVSSFLVGTTQSGGILVTNDGGASWSQSYSDGTGFLYAINCPRTSTSFVCYAAGSQGLVLYTPDGGATWATESTPVPSDWFLGITCANSTVCYLASKGGNLLKGGSPGWSLQASVSVFLYSVSCLGTWMCHAVGNSGTTLVTATGGVPLKAGDAQWTQQIPGTTAGLNGVSCPSVVRCYAVGQSGVILTTNPWGIDTVDNVQTGGHIASTESSGLGTPQFVARYLDYGSTLFTSDEAAFILDQGIPVVLIDDPNHTFTDGTTDANNAITLATNLGVPSGTAIFRDVEAMDPINATYIEAYYNAFKSAPHCRTPHFLGCYVPGFYENPLPDVGNHFGTEYCTAVQANAKIGTGTRLWSSVPELKRYDPHQALMPPWAADHPTCTNTTTTWQYKEDLASLGQGYPNVDVDEFLPPYGNDMWVGP